MRESFAIQKPKKIFTTRKVEDDKKDDEEEEENVFCDISFWTTLKSA